jgi:hypothetical protein
MSEEALGDATCPGTRAVISIHDTKDPATTRALGRVEVLDWRFEKADPTTTKPQFAPVRQTKSVGRK